VWVRPQGTAEDCGEEKTVADLMCEQLEFADVIVINKVLEVLGSARGATAPPTHLYPTNLAQ
jgi:G3E family GTPase